MSATETAAAPLQDPGPIAQPASPARRAPRSGAGRRITVGLAAVVLAFFVLSAFAPSLIAPHGYDEVNPQGILAAPSGDHLLGTDENGRDVLSRIVHGSANSLILGFGAVAIALAGGTLLGLSAALGHRVTNALLMRIVDVGLAFPEMLLALVIIAVVGPGPTNALIAIGVATIPSYARVIRAQALTVRRSSYVEAAHALGLHRTHVLLRHVLPNALRPVIVIATIGIGTATLAGAALSFIGLGVSPPAPEWGSMLATSRTFLKQAWWYGTFPGLAITALVVSTSVLGRALQAKFEGRRA
ncbi:ABC transporter permease [Georgenia ruanii]|uniref:ABC transporter permease subunit n=1 Tax=Georgenia ruanii TaxID=348442 RepID=A0A7J9V0C6_9MICO|nr:ABC transporter permease [Georgenia ruanii]MPV89580.1 ABC transporter permease subunit [Georgenia ruanii]